MSCERICGPQKQPCPTPYLCGTDCNFQCAETPHDKAIREFWAGNPGYEHTLIEQPAPEVEDDDWLNWKGFLVGCVGVLVAFAVAYGATK